MGGIGAEQLRDRTEATGGRTAEVANSTFGASIDWTQLRQPLYQHIGISSCSKGVNDQTSRAWPVFENSRNRSK